jgi:hypothetical protein
MLARCLGLVVSLRRARCRVLCSAGWWRVRQICFLVYADAVLGRGLVASTVRFSPMGGLPRSEWRVRSGWSAL